MEANGRQVYSGPVRQAPLLIPLSEDGPSGASLRKRPGVEGPVADALAAPFLVVTGTGGTKSEQSALEQAALQFIKAWETDFFVRCRVKRDDLVSSVDIANYNLILLGTPASNRILKKAAGKLPLTVEADSVTLAGRRYDGRNLRFEFVSPNPLNPGRCVVVIGSNSGSKWDLPNPHPARQAYYDFAIWPAAGNSPLAMGYFDSGWRNTISVEELAAQ